MKKRRLKVAPVAFLFGIVIFGTLLYSVSDIVRSLKNSPTGIKTINTIDGYPYTLNENDSAYVKSIFEKLKKELKEEIVDEEAYATYASMIFIADFYSLDSALSKNDVGGLEYVFKDYQKDFKAKAKDTIYRYVESNIYENRKQELPLVEEVEVTSLEQKMYDADKVSDGKAFYVEAKVKYEKDLDYPKQVKLILVHRDKLLEVAQMKTDK